MTSCRYHVRVVLALLLCFVGQGAGLGVEPGRPTILDAFIDPLGSGGFGTLLTVDRTMDPADNAAPFAASPDFLLPVSLGFESNGDLVVSDAEADPSLLGVVVGGGDGPGAVFRIDGSTGMASLLSDGSNYVPGLPGGTNTIFVEPAGLFVAPGGTVYLVDMDADPSGFGTDPAGFPGHGAVFVVDPVSGAVDLYADGSNAPGGLPAGEESLFVDPVGVIQDPASGDLYVLDLVSDPLELGRSGALFRVSASGETRVVAAPSEFDGPADLARLADGRIAVAGIDRVSGAGTIWVVDPAAPDPAAPAVVLSQDPAMEDPVGLAIAPNGWLYVTDAFADPLGLNRVGSLFRLDPVDGELSVVASSGLFRAVSDVAIPPAIDPAPTLTGADPSNLLQGETYRMTLTGTGFTPASEPDLGPDLIWSNLSVTDANSLSFDVEVPLAAVVGTRDARVHNPDLQSGVLPGGILVEERQGPWVDRVVPASGPRGAELILSVEGGNLDPLAQLDLGAGIQVVQTSPVDASRMEATVRIDPAGVLGPRDVLVTNPDTLSDLLVNGFEVTLPPPPRIDSVDPASLPPNFAATLEVSGDGFRPGQIPDLGPGVRITGIRFLGAELLELRVWVEASALPGTRTLVLTDAETGTGELIDAVTIEAGPVLQLARVRVLDDDSTTGNGSGFPDPGETVALVPTLRNVGNDGAVGTGVVLRLRPAVPGVTVESNFVSLPDMPPQSAATRSAEPHLRLAIAPEIPCGTSIPLEFEVQVLDRPAVFLAYDLRVGGPEAWEEEFSLLGRPGDRLGEVTAGIGDADGDGFPDWAVGAPGRDGAAGLDTGQVLVFSGAGGDLLAEWEGVAEGERLGAGLAGPGDLDGDGLADVVLGLPGSADGAGVVQARSVRDGSLLWEVVGNPGDALGSVLAAMADADGDTVGDVVSGAPDSQGGAGRSLLLRGSDGEILDELVGALPGDLLGAAAASLGDADGDGLADWAVGAPGAGGGAGEVVARAYHTTGGVELWRVPGGDPEGFGRAVRKAGDVDGDGWPDLAVSGIGADTRGAVIVLDRDGLPLRAYPSVEDEGFGADLAAAGDADGDGRDDLWVGAPLALGQSGEVRLMGGNGRRLGTLEAAATTNFGAGLAAAGDLDGDGWRDLLVGSPDSAPAGGSDAGLIFRFGSKAGCTGFQSCAQDPWEPNDAMADAASLVFQQPLTDPVSCPWDTDWYRIDRAAGENLAARVFWDPALGELGLTLLRSDGIPLDTSLGGAGAAEVARLALEGGSYFLRVEPDPGSVSIPYALETLDPNACEPREEVKGLRVARVGPELQLGWDPVRDVCHGRYAVFRGSTAVPSAGGSFPDDPAFALVSDLDGSAADTGARIAAQPGLGFFLVVSRNASGASGPSGHY